MKIPTANNQHGSMRQASAALTDVVAVPANDDRLDHEPAGRELADQTVADGTDSTLVDKGPAKEERPSGETSSVLVGNETHEATDEEDGGETHETVQVEGTTTDAAGHHCPSRKDSNGVETVLAKSEVVCVGVAETSLLEEAE